MYVCTSSDPTTFMLDVVLMCHQILCHRQLGWPTLRLDFRTLCRRTRLCCAGLAEVCHKSNVPLIVDEAHGSHFAFDSTFPQVSPVTLVMQPIHLVHGRPLLWLLQDWLAKRIAACLQGYCLSVCACLP
jgi:hypothetical protein